MNIKQNYIDRLNEICRMFEIGFDHDPEIFNNSDFEVYEHALNELRCLTGIVERNTYLEEIEEMKTALPF